MKMADAEKTEELVNSKTPPETALEVAAGDETLKTETSPSEKEGDSPLQADPGLLSSMPCLLMELRRDSPESQQASTESEKQMSSRTYESDSSNHCMLSPSSSGHLADSDTLSSAEENGAPLAGASCAAEGGDSNSGAGGLVAGGRKSRRSRSESEMSSTTSMAAKKNRWQATGADKQNGRLAKVKGHRSQKHKERMRLLRQKREAAARKKYNLLQDSSTSDSDLTCDSSTSSSDDDKEVLASGKTIAGNIPDGPPVLAHYDISDTNSDREVVSVSSLLAAAVAHELKTYRTQDTGANSWQNKGDQWSSMETGHINAEFATGDLSTCGPLQIKEEINVASSDSEVEIVGVQENTRCIHPRGGVIHSISSWKHGPISQYNSTRQSHLWTSVSPQPNWSSPPEVVDLTLDEDARRKYLL
ncbi:uncharacterized protein C18orf25-like isoform X3 [Polyodon spathula]|uniref:uncharacterized protein C18orf25-like isoform X3 n=1 Tax=Polyodon spathula TaxID=7913 RepID=UPI001B7EB52B|nr:uncharacterized protein C18orf25-like isoform X3 [Polyodon spathula]